MNHKERVSAVLSGKLVDRIPVATWGHDFLREWSAEELAAHTIERHHKFDYDFIKLNPRWTMFAEPWGNTYQPPATQKFPRLTHKIVNCAADISAVPVVSPDHPVLQEHVSALRQVVVEIGDDVDIIATVFSPLSVLGLLCGGVGEPLTTYAEQSPGAVHRALDHITETLEGHACDLINGGASGVFYAALQWTSLDICDNAFYESFGRPYDLRVLKAAGTAPLNIFHVCGNNIALDRYLDYPTPILNWDNFGPGNPSLIEAARITDKIIAGGIPHRKLHKLSPEALQEITNEALEGVGAKVILAGGCGIGATVSDEIRQLVTTLADQMKTRP
jgi:uroporphyrinogen decarboxylase